MRKTIITGLVGLLFFLFVGCNDKLDVQQMYEFSVSTMPVQKKIKMSETVEIRCQLNRTGIYKPTKYYIGYFQSEGNGLLQYENCLLLLPNNFYEFENEIFRLYYTSHCQDQQTIDITVHDNFNQEYKFSVSFTNESVGRNSILMNKSM